MEIRAGSSIQSRVLRLPSRDHSSKGQVGARGKMTDLKRTAPSLKERLRQGCLRPWSKVRSQLRGVLFGVLNKWVSTDEGRASVANALRGMATPPLHLTHDALRSPYPELAAKKEASVGLVVRPVFITARFRSGSTLLWNIFRHIADCTAYYEPLNERRWFDATRRQTYVDATHRHVDDYWREYENLSQLGDHFQDAWTWRHFFMDADFPDPHLRSYITTLIERAAGRAVLQFNRIDFRLPWIRRHFPSAYILHLYRHPRDQWLSTLWGSEDCPLDIAPSAFESQDKFYLLRWSRDLRYRFPFLDERCLTHPYQLSYLIWKLSYAFGQTYANKSISFENLTLRPDQVLPELLSEIGIHSYDLSSLCALVEPPRVGAWRGFADDAWFLKHEAHCDAIIDEFFCESQPTQ